MLRVRSVVIVPPSSEFAPLPLIAPRSSMSEGESGESVKTVFGPWAGAFFVVDLVLGISMLVFGLVVMRLPSMTVPTSLTVPSFP